MKVSGSKKETKSVIQEEKHLQNGEEHKHEYKRVELESIALVNSVVMQNPSAMTIEKEGISRNNSSQKKEDDLMVPELKSNGSKNSQMMDFEFKAGEAQFDTLRFSDELALANYSKDFYKLWQLSIYHDEKTIFGFKSDYFVFGPNKIVEGQQWLGTKWEGGYQSTMQLAADEFITQVSGKADKVIKSISLTTNKGRKVTLGGSEGEPFELNAPNGYCFRTISGGFGEHIHYIELEPFPIVLFDSNL